MHQLASLATEEDTWWRHSVVPKRQLVRSVKSDCVGKMIPEPLFFDHKLFHFIHFLISNASYQQKNYCVNVATVKTIKLAD